MPVINDISFESDDKKNGMTLEDLRQFLAACDGADGSTKINVRVSLRGGIRKISADVR